MPKPTDTYYSRHSDIIPRSLIYCSIYSMIFCCRGITTKTFPYLN